MSKLSNHELEGRILDFVYCWIINRRVPVASIEIAQGLGIDRSRVVAIIRKLVDEGKLIRTSGFGLTFPKKLTC